MDEQLKQRLYEARTKFKEAKDNYLQISNAVGSQFWEPIYGDSYYYIEANGTLQMALYHESLETRFKEDQKNVFKTCDQAFQHLENLKTKAKLRNLAEELNEGQGIDWENEHQTKYYIMYSRKTGIIDVALATTYQTPSVIYCLDVRFADKAIDRIGASNLIKLMESDV